jgi:hypothetical protein
MYTAAELRAKAQEKNRQDQELLEAWIENLAETIVDYCDDQAAEGAMRCELSDIDLAAMLDGDVTEDKVDAVIYGAKKLLENDCGYRVSVDNFNSKTKSEGDIVSITVIWSEEVSK